MYTVGSLLPVDGVDPGSTLLIVGPPMTGKRSLTMELLAQGFDEEGVAVVSTDTSATEVRDSVARYADSPGEDLPLGVIDCVGDSHGNSGLGSLDSRVSSPADLTGIGMELTTLLEQLYTDYSSRMRFGLISLTTMSMYTDPEQVIRFLHVITSRISEADALGLIVAHSDTMDPEHLQQLRSFVDGVVEVRENDGETELRVLGLADSNTDWTPFNASQQTVAQTDARQLDRSEDVPIADSLRSIFDDVRSGAPTLTVCNYEGESEALGVIERYFDRHGVDVRQASLDVAQPSSVALLHHGDNLLASETVTALLGAIDIDSATDEGFKQRQTSDLLTNLEQSVFGAAAADKPLLIDVSHNVELLANRVGTGRLHAGFQQLSNLVDDEQASRIYERLAKSGVEVHVYGAPDTTTELSGVTVHEDDGEEMAESWFVVYDGGGNPNQRAALLAIERDSTDVFEGFWTYDADIVGPLDAYLTTTYLDDRPAEKAASDSYSSH